MVGVEQAGQAGEVEGMESGSMMGQGWRGGGLGQGKEYAEREGRMGGGRGAWVVGVEQGPGAMDGTRSHGSMRSVAGCVGGLGQGREYAEREGRMGGGRGAWVVG